MLFTLEAHTAQLKGKIDSMATPVQAQPLPRGSQRREQGQERQQEVICCSSCC